MLWVSNSDPPLYVWEDDEWYNQKDKITYKAYPEERNWGNAFLLVFIEFPKKTRIMNEIRTNP